MLHRMRSARPAVVRNAVRFILPDALVELRRHGVIARAAAADWTPLQVFGEKAVVVLDRGADQRLVVKIDRPSVVWAAARFLETYRGVPLVPVLRHVDAAHRFLAYDFIAGVTGRMVEASAHNVENVDKAQTLLALAHGLLSRYVPTDARPGSWLHAQYGGRRAPGGHTTWQRFLGGEVVARHNPLCPYLPSPAHALVRHLAAAPPGSGAAAPVAWGLRRAQLNLPRRALGRGDRPTPRRARSDPGCRRALRWQRR